MRFFLWYGIMHKSSWDLAGTRKADYILETQGMVLKKLVIK